MYKTTPLIAMFALSLLSACSSGPDFGNADMSDAAIKERIAPVGQFNVAIQTAKVPVEASTTTPSARAEAKAARSGEAIYQGNCSACHGTGAAGAPKMGDVAAWAPRVAQGMDMLMNAAKSGKNAMPPKGLCMDCSDDELKSAIEYMVNNSK